MTRGQNTQVVVLSGWPQPWGASSNPEKQTRLLLQASLSGLNVTGTYDTEREGGREMEKGTEGESWRDRERETGRHTGSVSDFGLGISDRSLQTFTGVRWGLSDGQPSLGGPLSSWLQSPDSHTRVCCRDHSSKAGGVSLSGSHLSFRPTCGQPGAVSSFRAVAAGSLWKISRSSEPPGVDTAGLCLLELSR